MRGPSISHRGSRLAVMLAAVATLALSVTLARTGDAASGAVPGECRQGRLPSGSLSVICVPASGWTGDLVVFAHGYVSPYEPLALALAHSRLPDGGSVADVVQAAGHAYAAASYRDNGLAILEGVQDLRELSAAFATSAGVPRRTYAVGVSEGALVVTLLAERHPLELSGALAACGPIGGFRMQAQYFGDFRVLFDYFFPRVLPGSPIDVPASVRRKWSVVYEPRIARAIRRRPHAAAQLVRAARATIDVRDRRRLVRGVVDVLWYSAFATNDAAVKLGGNPFDNRSRRYSGSANDRRLNRRVRRFRASSAALASMRAYETTGVLRIPMLTAHTRSDPIVPFRHQRLYAAKVRRAGAAANLTAIPVSRYGHCNFRASELRSVLTALSG